MSRRPAHDREGAQDELSKFFAGAFLYEDENPREMYFRLLALKEQIVQ